jgi:hypothetical protein
MQAQTVVTHVTSYDVLVGGVVSYTLGDNIDLWEETTYYYLGWQTKISHKASLPMRFIVGQFRKFNKLIILGGFSRLPH